MKRSYYIFMLIAAVIMSSCSKKKNDAGFTVPFEKYTCPTDLQ